MKKKETIYRPLSGRGARGPLTRTRLWLGDDHILNVDSHGVSEDYKRFYFKDIQAIITRKTTKHIVWTVVVSIIIAVFLLLILLIDNNWVRIIWSLGLFLGIIALFGNIVRGPSCVCHLITAVQKEELPSLNRIMVARDVIQYLKIRIESEQGKVTADEVREKITTGVSSAPSRVTRAKKSTSKPVEKKVYRGSFHPVMFLSCILFSCVSALSVVYRSPPVVIVLFLVFAWMFINILITLAIHAQRSVHKDLHRITLVTLVFGLFCYLYFHGFLMYSMMSEVVQNTGGGYEQEFFNVFASKTLLDSYLFLSLTLFIIIFSLLLGISGLLKFYQHRADLVAPPPITRPKISGGENAS